MCANDYSELTVYDINDPDRLLRYCPQVMMAEEVGVRDIVGVHRLHQGERLVKSRDALPRRDSTLQVPRRRAD